MKKNLEARVASLEREILLSEKQARNIKLNQFLHGLSENELRAIVAGNIDVTLTKKFKQAGLELS